MLSFAFRHRAPIFKADVLVATARQRVTCLHPVVPLWGITSSRHACSVVSTSVRRCSSIISARCVSQTNTLLSPAPLRTPKVGCGNPFQRGFCTATPVLVAPPALVKPGFERTVGIWLLGVSGFLISMIALGGYTRLSGSGLSMTDWRIEGRSLPYTTEQWTAEFENYKLFPEYQRLHNGSMDLDEFKRIYFVEWFHRMWGRTAGILFAAPLAYFAVRGALKPRFAVGLGSLLGLGFSQAFVGWWMVRSGLDAPEQHTPYAGENQVPRVSPYRLASHFSAGLTLYVGCLWATMSLLRSCPTNVHPTLEAVKAARLLRGLAIPVCSIVALTILSGPFVAGNDAGLAYNTWPKMLDDWVPPEWIAAATEPAKKWRMFFEDTACVQFDHRILAYASTIGTLCLSLRAVTLNGASPAVVNVARMLPVVVSLQAALGITTLLWYVPIELGVLHQAGGIAVLSTVLLLLHTLRVPTIASAAASTASRTTVVMPSIRPAVASAAPAL